MARRSPTRTSFTSLPSLHHRAQAVPPEDVGQGGLGGILVLGEVTIRRIQGGIMDLQDDLVRLRNRIRRLSQAETADALEIVNEPGFHAPK